MSFNPEIIYTIITYNKSTLLSEYSQYRGFFQFNCIKLIKTIKTNQCGSFDYQIYKFNYMDMDDITVMCLAHKEYPLDVSYCFLQEVLEKFGKVFSREEIISANQYSLNEKFENILRDFTMRYNIKPKCVDNLSRLSEEILEFRKNVLNAENILLERGEKIEEIKILSAKLKNESDAYYFTSTQTRKKSYCNKWLWTIFAIVVLLIIGYFVSVIICDWDYSKCKSKVTSSSRTSTNNLNFISKFNQ